MPSSPKQIIAITSTRSEDSRRLLRSIGAYCNQSQPWSILVDDDLRSVNNQAWLFSKQWDGILVNIFDPSIVLGCKQRGIPCIDLNDESDIVPGVPKIRPDNEAMGHLVAEHYKERGYRRFAFCGFSDQHWSEERKRGFIEAVTLLGYKCFDFETIYRDEHKTLHPDLVPDWEHQERERIKQWLKALPQPIAIMAANDHRATQLIDACSELGINVPNDIAIVGANDNTLRCELRQPSISSIPINAKAMAKLTVDTMNGLIAGNAVPFVEKRVEPLDVVTRQSSDALAISDPTIARATLLIRNRHGIEVDVPGLAKQVHSSRSQLERGFRKHLGHSPQTEIRLAQSAYVKELLLTTNLPINEIATVTGFKHPEYMNVVFKKLTGETPGQFRIRTSDTVHNASQQATT
ncbi:XylR family transcriptional regulator [Pelagicoccus sp. SDUM812005]|uniref:XylR family transcriptional regulator n=1 Tax=Pelagicoccus sp. SDUM812005 TaxID=3041257 RepID=UPI00280E58E3|nr:XylR family transcriptional regulator [Pelagicoccus sp. SDUM812005]MDQ8180321.1 XylR family transcriptional regulator [Pelagicoccus sp. SDUM812005]